MSQLGRKDIKATGFPAEAATADALAKVKKAQEEKEVVPADVVRGQSAVYFVWLVLQYNR